MTTGKTIALTRRTFVGSVMSLLFNMLSAAAAKSLQSCPTLCDPIDSSPQGSSVHGILQARTLEWVAITFSEVALVVKNSLANAEDIRDMGSIPGSERPPEGWQWQPRASLKLPEDEL